MGGVDQSGDAKLPVTVAIPVRNEEQNLDICLRALSRFAEVVVIDSHSTDNTAAIAEKHGATVIQFEWNGKYPKKRNWFLTHHKPSQPWVLFLDADELVDDAFCEELQALLPSTECAGFWLSYANYFLGKKLSHGLPQRKLALFRVGHGAYEQIEEDHWSSLDMEIHEHPIIDGIVGELQSKIEHRDDKGLSHFIDRHREYALWEARRFVDLKRGGTDQAQLTRRQSFKYANLSKWWYASFYFLFVYFGKLGFLDGSAGFHYAYYKAWYFHSIRLLIKENMTGT